MAEHNKYTAMYQVMNDDLKDAEMIAKYAHHLKHEDEEIGNIMHKYSKFRLEHFEDMMKLFNKCADKDDEFKKGSIMNCLWDKTKEMLCEWADEIEEHIEEY